MPLPERSANDSRHRGVVIRRPRPPGVETGGSSVGARDGRPEFRLFLVSGPNDVYVSNVVPTDRPELTMEDYNEAVGEFDDLYLGVAAQSMGLSTRPPFRASTCRIGRTTSPTVDYADDERDRTAPAHPSISRPEGPN